MNTKNILDELKSERERIDRAIAALEALDETGTAKRPGRPAGGGNSAAKPARRKLSAAARKRIADAQKRRWAAAKAAAKKTSA